MTAQAHVEAVSALGPGFADWTVAVPILRGEAPLLASRCRIPQPETLPPAERRRTGTAVKVAIAAAAVAAASARRDVATLPTVFAASGGDGDNCHAICEALATEERILSPTRFHNSVHNAPSGYWSIGVRSMAPSATVAAFDGSFAAGLLEAALQLQIHEAVMLVAYDTCYPEPLHAKRPIHDAFGVAIVLARSAGAGSLARLALSLGDAAATRCDGVALESLRTTNPAARALPLLALLARRQSGTVALDYLAPPQLMIEVTQT